MEDREERISSSISLRRPRHGSGGNNIPIQHAADRSFKSYSAERLLAGMGFHNVQHNTERKDHGETASLVNHRRHRNILPYLIIKHPSGRKDWKLRFVAEFIFSTNQILNFSSASGFTSTPNPGLSGTSTLPSGLSLIGFFKTASRRGFSDVSYSSTGG